MKKRFKLLISILICLISINTVFASNEKEVVLNNGLRVFIKPMRAAPVVTVNYWVKNGSIYEGEGESGFSELVSKLLFESSINYPNQVLKNQLSKLGVKISKNSSNDCQSFCFTGASKNFSKILNLSWEGLFNASFSENDIKKSISILKKEIAELETRPDVVVHNIMMQEAFAVHPCRRPYYGLNPNFQSADVFFIDRFYKKNYTLSNTIVVVTGDVDPNTVIDSIKKLSEKVKNNTYIEPELPKEIPQTSYREVIKYVDLHKVYLSFGWKIPNLEGSDKYALYVLAKMLGGNEDSIFWKRLVKGRKTCEFINAGYEASRFQGVFVVSAITVKSKLRYFVDDVRRIANGFIDEIISEQTLEEVKKNVVNEDIFEREGVESSALDYGSFTVISKASDADDFENGIISVNLEDVKRVASEFLRDENLTVAILQSPPISEDAAPIMLTLDNGIKVILKENHSSPVISVSTKFIAEALREDKKNAGIACLASELLYRSFDSDNKTFISKLEKLGAKLTYNACKDYISFDLKTVSSNFIPAFDTFLKMIEKPEFPTAYSQARSILENYLKLENYDLKLQNEYNGLRTLFGNSPLSYSIYGRLDDLSKTKRSDVIDFYKKNFIPSNMVIAIVGDFYTNEIKDYLLASFGGFSTLNKISKDYKISSEIENLKTDSPVLMKNTTDEAYILYVSKSIPTNDKRFIPLNLACRILEYRLKNSFREADKTGLMSSSIEIQNNSFADDGYFKASVITDKDNVATVAQLLNLEIEAFKVANIPEYQLQEAKDAVYAEYTLGLIDNLAMADVCSRDEVLGLGFDYYTKIYNILASTTMDNVFDAAKELMLPEKKYLVCVSSSNSNELVLDGKKLVFRSSIIDTDIDPKLDKNLKTDNVNVSKDSKSDKTVKTDNNNASKDSKSDKTSKNVKTDNNNVSKDSKSDKTSKNVKTDNNNVLKDSKSDKTSKNVKTDNNNASKDSKSDKTSKNVKTDNTNASKDSKSDKTTNKEKK